jgi:2-methylcitrate dehydratase PrpD
LGSKFHLEADLRIKPYSSCSATHNGLEAMLRLAQQHDINPQSVETIECDLKPYPLVRHRPQRGYEGRFSMAFCLALALIYRRVYPDDFVDEQVQNPIVQELMRRTRHTPDAPGVVVALKDGRRLEEKLLPSGNLKGWEAVQEKFTSCLSALCTADKAEKVIDLVRRLETISSIRMLTGALQTNTA